MENKKTPTVTPCRLDALVKPFLHFYFIWCHFKFIKLDLGWQLGGAIGPYIFRINLPFQVRSKVIKKFLLKIGEYIWMRCCLVPNAPSFRIFLKDMSPNFRDYQTTGVRLLNRPIDDRRKILQQYQCLRAVSCCLLNKNHKDVCKHCTARIEPMWKLFV